MAGGSVEAHISGGGIAQDDARNRRTSSRSRPVGTTELPGKGFSIQKRYVTALGTCTNRRFRRRVCTCWPGCPKLRTGTGPAQSTCSDRGM